MVEHALLADLLVVFGIGLVLVVALARLRIPGIVALMLAGIVAGPSGFRVIHTPERVETLAEIGIVLLLFTVGLDFSLGTVKQVWRRTLAGGSLQIFGTAALVAAVLLVAGVATRLAIFIGLFVALSSTAIVLNGLALRNELSAPHGRLMTGVLLLQDLAIVALLLLVPILSGQTPLSAAAPAAAKALLAITAVAVVSRFALPFVLRLVTASGRREAFPLAILVASVGTAWASSLLGLSMAVGAFLAGLMLAESEYSHQAYAEIRGVRDVLAALFFISLGMLVDLGSALRFLPAIVGVAAALIVVKAGAAAAALWLAGAPSRIAVTAAVGLAQVGEFSFILGRSGLEAGLVPAATWQVLLGASILTMMVTPSLLALAPVIGARVGPRKADAALAEGGAAHHPADHVIILGFGVGGRLVARALRELRIPYLVLELNGATVRAARRAGEHIAYGDAMSPESLHGAGIERAAAVVSLMNDPAATERMISSVRAISPSLPIVVRTRYALESERLQRLGATVAVAEELEASLEVLAQLLARLHVAGNVIEPLVDVFRRESVGLRTHRAPSARWDALPEAIQRMPIATHRVEPGQWAIGRSLAELDLRAQTGASVLAIQHGADYTTAPAGDTRISEGDTLYLLGDESDIALARHHLAAGKVEVAVETPNS
ncbi:MAG TPA: cation:proton antiporter [Vicinamibacterales bacterium]|nr:cation:proton antiporter [Vicinamibacterales bacterium]